MKKVAGIQKQSLEQSQGEKDPCNDGNPLFSPRIDTLEKNGKNECSNYQWNHLNSSIFTLKSGSGAMGNRSQVFGHFQRQYFPQLLLIT